MTTSNELHVIFGTGPAGSSLAEVLLSEGKRVRSVNRSGKADLPAGVELVGADALDPSTARALCAGATAVYHCANVPYEQQIEILPRMQATLIDGAARANARLIVLDTLYVYGETGGQVMTEDTPHAATTRKGRMRAQLAQTYLQAHAAGTLQVALGRAADFFGPQVRNSVLGEHVFPAALAGQPALLFGDIDLPHSYGYIGDVARGLATLGSHEEALGRAWLLPVAPAVSPREIIQRVGEQLGRPITTHVLSRADVQQLGQSSVLMYEFEEMFYQYTEPQIVDSRAFEQAFGWQATPLDQAIGATIAWYRAHTALPT